MDTWVVADKTRFKDQTENLPQVHTADPYQLYFKIIEVSQLDGRKDKNAKFIVKFWLETVEGVKVSGSSGKTRTHTKSLQPIWNEEWIIPRISGDQHKFRLHFVLYECFTLRSDTPIGECIYDADQNTALGVREIVLDLLTPNRSKSSAKGKLTEMAASPRVCGKIKILCHKQPLFESSEERDKRRNETEKRSYRLPSLRIVLEKASYYPGEILRGLVICNLGRTAHKPSLTLNFVGETINRWRSIDDLEYASRMIHVNYMVDSLEDASQGENGNQLCFPFSFPLPDHIPPSFVARDTKFETQGSTKYRLSTCLDGSKNSETAFIEILARYRSCIPNSLTMGQISSTENPDKAVKLSITVPSFIEAGSQLPVKFSIQNTTKKSINSVTATIFQESFFHGENSRAWHLTSSFDTIATETIARGAFSTLRGDNDPDSILPIKPGQEREFTMMMEIPASTPPTALEELNPLLNVQYCVQGTTLSEGILVSPAQMVARVPLIVSRSSALASRSHIPPASLVQKQPARANSDHALGTKGNGFENTTSLHSKVGDDQQSQKSADISPSTTVSASDASPGSIVGQPSSSTSPPSTPSSTSLQSLDLNHTNTLQVPIVAKTTEDQNRQNCIILSTQSFNPISSKNANLTTLNDAPTTYYIDPRLVTLRPSPQISMDFSAPASDPLKIFEERKRIQKVVLRDDSTSQSYLQAALQKAMAENGKTNCEPPTVGNEKSDSNMLPPATENDLRMIVYCNNQAVPSFADFFPPRPLTPGSNDIPLIAASLPDFSSLGVLKTSNDLGRQNQN